MRTCALLLLAELSAAKVDTQGQCYHDGGSCMLRGDKGVPTDSDLDGYIHCLNICCQNYKPPVLLPGTVCADLATISRCEDRIGGLYRALPDHFRMVDVCPYYCDTCDPVTRVSEYEYIYQYIYSYFYYVLGEGPNAGAISDGSTTTTTLDPDWVQETLHMHATAHGNTGGSGTSSLGVESKARAAMLIPRVNPEYWRQGMTPDGAELKDGAAVTTGSPRPLPTAAPTAVTTTEVPQGSKADSAETATATTDEAAGLTESAKKGADRPEGEATHERFRG